MDETRVDGDDDDETGYSEDDHVEGEVKRMESKEDGTLTDTCQVGGYAQSSNIIPMTNGDTQGVAQHFLKYHTVLNVRIRVLKVLPGTVKNPPDLMTLMNHVIVSPTHTFHCH
jgi:hypothetical protein